MRASPLPYGPGRLFACCLFLFFLTVTAGAAPGAGDTVPVPMVYLNMNEGSGPLAVDFSGHGNSGEIHGAARIAESACGNALFFNGNGSYVAIPYRTGNHPEKEITVDLWFAVDSYDRQVLVSTSRDGGYRIAFDDGNDLWWTVSTSRGEVSVPVQHESITLHRWHHLAGTYDGKVSRVYLDGVLRRTVNGTGGIVYSRQNDVILGAEAGTGSITDAGCSGFLRGALDEVRIYDRVLTYGQVMDDRFSCPQEPRVPEFTPFSRVVPAGCDGLNAAFTFPDRGKTVHRIIAGSADDTATLTVKTPPKSTLSVSVRDAYGAVYPDTWYFEIAENGRRLTRSIGVPNTINTPADASLSEGNATIRIRYFDGPGRFPASAFVTIGVTVPEKPVIEPLPHPILANPIIVIYTASWATVIALVLVFFWLRRRRRETTGEKKEPKE